MDWGSRITYLASTALKERTTPFGIKDADRTQHMCVMGRVGTGRAELLARMALQDIERGVGTVVVDASGNLGPLIIERMPKDAVARLIYLDAADAEYPFSWNAVEEFRGSAAAEEIFHRMLPSVYGLQQSPLTDLIADYILKTPEKSVLEFFTLLTDEKARQEAFLAGTPEAERVASLMDLEKDVVQTVSESGRYLAKDTMVRNMVGQSEGKFNFKTLAEGGVIILDLSRIRIFPTRITPLVRLFSYAARAFATGGAPAALYLHDCLRYWAESDADYFFADRSLALALSDTIYRETDMPLREKSLSRCGSVVTFQPHQSDLPMVQKVFYPYVSPEELSGLEKGEACIALTIDGVRSKPFFAESLPLPDRQNVSLQDIYVLSRQKYTTARQKVDQQFKKNTDDDQKKGGPPQFSDAFKTMFNKRAAGGNAALGALQKPAPGPNPEQPPKEEPQTPQPPAPPAPAPKAPEPVEQKPRELSEEDLRQLLYVGPLPA